MQITILYNEYANKYCFAELYLHKVLNESVDVVNLINLIVSHINASFQ